MIAQPSVPSLVTPLRQGVKPCEHPQKTLAQTLLAYRPPAPPGPVAEIPVPVKYLPARVTGALAVGGTLPPVIASSIHQASAPAHHAAFAPGPALSPKVPQAEITLVVTGYPPQNPEYVDRVADKLAAREDRPFFPPAMTLAPQQDREGPLASGPR